MYIFACIYVSINLYTAARMRNAWVWVTNENTIVGQWKPTRHALISVFLFTGFVYTYMVYKYIVYRVVLVLFIFVLWKRGCRNYLERHLEQVYMKKYRCRFAKTLQKTHIHARACIYMNKFHVILWGRVKITTHERCGKRPRVGMNKKSLT